MNELLPGVSPGLDSQMSPHMLSRITPGKPKLHQHTPLQSNMAVEEEGDEVSVGLCELPVLSQTLSATEDEVAEGLMLLQSPVQPTKGGVTPIRHSYAHTSSASACFSASSSSKKRTPVAGRAAADGKAEAEGAWGMPPPVPMSATYASASMATPLSDAHTPAPTSVTRSQAAAAAAAAFKVAAAEMTTPNERGTVRTGSGRSRRRKASGSTSKSKSSTSTSTSTSTSVTPSSAQPHSAHAIPHSSTREAGVVVDDLDHNDHFSTDHISPFNHDLTSADFSQLSTPAEFAALMSPGMGMGMGMGMGIGMGIGMGMGMGIGSDVDGFSFEETSPVSRSSNPSSPRQVSKRVRGRGPSANNSPAGQTSEPRTGGGTPMDEY